MLSSGGGLGCNSSLKDIVSIRFFFIIMLASNISSGESSEGGMVTVLTLIIVPARFIPCQFYPGSGMGSFVTCVVCVWLLSAQLEVSCRQEIVRRAMKFCHSQAGKKKKDAEPG